MQVYLCGSVSSQFLTALPMRCPLAPAGVLERQHPSHFLTVVCVCPTCCLPMQVYLSGSVSSQFLTALLMAAPLCTGKDGIEIIIKVRAGFFPESGFAILVYPRKEPALWSQLVGSMHDSWHLLCYMRRRVQL